jgi:hypothetical protein
MSRRSVTPGDVPTSALTDRPYPGVHDLVPAEHRDPARCSGVVAFMAAFAVGILAEWIKFVAEPNLPRLIVASIVTPFVGLALAREASNARRMGRMLVTGT